MPQVLEVVLEYILAKDQMSGLLVVAVIVLVWLWVRRKSNTPPEKIDLELLRFINNLVKKNQRVTTSSIYAEFIDESTQRLDLSLGRLEELRYIKATMKPTGNPINVVVPYYEIHSITEKGYRALRIARYV